MPGKKTIIIFLVIGIISLFAFAGYLFYGFKYGQEETLFEKPAISKQEAVRLAGEFIKTLGFDARNYPYRRIGYDSYNRETLYLLTNYGYKGTKQLIKKEKIPYTYWSVTWGGLEDENLNVKIDNQDGRIISYRLSRYRLPQEKITNLKEKEAKILAEKFLGSLGIDMSQFELLNINKNTRGIQEEYYFKWGKKNLKLGQATYIINLSVEADKIASYSQSLELPKGFRYSYGNSNFVSRFWVLLSSSFSAILGIILLVLAIIKRGIMNWRLGRIWASGLGLVFLINFLNEQSSYTFYMDAIYKLIITAMYALIILILIPITELLFRQAFNKEIFITRNKQNNILTSLITCYSLTFFGFAIVAGMYGLLNRFKIIWDVGSGDVLSTLFTSKIIYLSPFLVGIIPAFMEEFFRGFTMAFSKKIFKNTFIAIFISAFLWGFGHTVTDGSFYPGYAVGIDKFINGIFVGYILLYFGIEVAILWHFLNNFLVTNIFLFYLGSDYAIYASLLSLVIVLPFFLAIPLYFRKCAISGSPSNTTE
jgi:hypothetical protein